MNQMVFSLSDLVTVLPLMPEHHAPADPLYQWLKKLAHGQAEIDFGPLAKRREIDFGVLGKIGFPYENMGAVSSVNLFDLDELILFSFFWHNRKKYKKVVDMGANLGLHSIVLSRCGFKVSCFEPDPHHYKILTRNLKKNHCANVKAYNMAVSVANGSQEFIRVMGNTTSSHIAGAKAHPYGNLERFDVKTAAARQIMAEADLVKMDVEGHEKEILLSTKASDWKKTDCLLEVQSRENAQDILKHFKKLRINLYSQKTNWQKVTTINDMPHSYKDGSLFISCGKGHLWAP